MGRKGHFDRVATGPTYQRLYLDNLAEERIGGDPGVARNIKHLELGALLGEPVN